jgi:hypothetical protein
MMLRSFVSATPALASAAALSVALSGCAGFGKTSEPEPSAGSPDKIKQVGVLAVMGDEFHVVRMGFTNFQNVHYDADVSDWKVDQIATDTALKLLAGNERIKAAPLDRSRLSTDQLASNRSDALWQAAQRQGLDTLIIVRPSEISALKHFTPGVGLFERKMVGEGDRCVYTAYVVKVFDVRTRKELDSNWGGPSPCKVGSNEQVPFKKEFSEYSSAEKDEIRRLLTARFDDTLSYTLGTLHYGAPKRKKRVAPATVVAASAPAAGVAGQPAVSGVAPAAAPAAAAAPKVAVNKLPPDPDAPKATTTSTAAPDDDKDDQKDDDDDTLTPSMIWKFLPEFKAHKY